MGFIVAKLVYEQAGIVIREHKEAMTRGRLARRVKALGLNSVAEYCAFLKHRRQAADEIPELINAVTTNHTAFFRERHHFDHLRKDVLPKLICRSAAAGAAASGSGHRPRPRARSPTASPRSRAT